MPDTHVRSIIGGEHAVSGRPDEMLTTLLGSCVAACLWDDAVPVGGLNHIVLPEGDMDSARSLSLGINLMELLINDLLKAGARRDRLKAKLFGGARMVTGLSDVGARNARFAEEFLERENIPLVAQSLGGTSARKIQFWPASGRARQLLLAPDAAPVEPRPKLPPASSDDIELF